MKSAHLQFLKIWKDLTGLIITKPKLILNLNKDFVNLNLLIL